MKKLKLILTNLILILILVILTGGMVYADNIWDVNISIVRDENDKPKSYNLQMIKNGEIQTLEELVDVSIKLLNSESNGARNLYFGITSAEYNKPFDNWTWSFFEDTKFAYNPDTKTIIITPEDPSATLGLIVNALEVVIEDKDGEEHTLTKTFTSPVTLNASFKVITFIKDNKVKYHLRSENATFRELGTNLGVYFNAEFKDRILDLEGRNEIALDNETYYSNQKLTIKNITTGQVLGTAIVPNIERIILEQVDPNSDEAKIVFKKVDSSGKETIMKKSDFLELGWKDVDFQNVVTNKKYTLDFSTWTFKGEGQVSSDGTITLPEKGGYQVWTHSTGIGGNGDNTYHGFVYPIDLSLFTTELGREHESYTLNYETSLDDLIKANAGKDFKIGIYNMEGKLIPNKEVDASWHVKGNPHKQIFGDDTKLYLDEYTKVRVWFHCEETGLDKTIELEVPKLDEISDLEFKIESPGKVKLYSKKTGETVTISELYKILGYGQGNNNNSDYKLGYNSGGLHIIDKLEARVSSDHDEIVEFTNFTDVTYAFKYTTKELERLSPNDLMAYINQIKIFYDYYKIVKDKGDVPLLIRVNDSLGNAIDIPIEKPTAEYLNTRGLPNENPYFEGITGIKVSDYDEMAATLEAVLAKIATLVDNGVLHVSADENEKLFYIKDSGIYYVEVENNSGTSNGEPYICVPFLIESDERKLAYAGRLTGETKENKQLGEYVYFNSDTVYFGDDDTQANCFPLIGGAIYKIKNSLNVDMTVRFKRLDITGDGSDYELIEILDETASNLYFTLQSDKNGYESVEVGYILADNANLFEALGRMLARFVRSLANGLNYLVQMSLRAVGGDNITSTVDIDKIIFNNYPDTSIAFFKTSTGGENPSKMIGMFRDAVNKWYAIFRAVAIAGYLIILLYIGVRILLSVGSNKQSQYKEMLTNWLVGIILLIFFPYVIKYAIEINNVLVSKIEDSKTGALKVADASSTIDMSKFSLPTIADADNFGAISQQMDNNPYPDSDNSYMAVISRKAHKTGTLVDAFVYLIMVWQFIMIVIIYYKRVFTIAFLIAIFPFVTLSYAIDKVADGKAQAFNTWNKELVSNIFIQSIHAVIYVFVIAATYTDGEYSGDWLLSIIGISFLFKGEEILKKIIGQGSGETVRSLKQTAQRATATIVAAKVATKSISDNVIGAGSHLGKSVNMYRQWRTEKKVSENMDFFAKPKPVVPLGNTLRTFNPSLSGNVDYNQLADDIQIVNNEGMVDAETYARALDNVLANRGNLDANVQTLMKGLNLSDEQLNALGDMQRSAVEKLTSVDKNDREQYVRMKETIDADIEAKLKIIIPGSDNDPEVRRKRAFMKRAMYYRMRDGDRKEKHKSRATDILEVKDELTQAKNRRKQFFNPSLVARNGIGNPFAETAKPSALSRKATNNRDAILSTYYGGKTVDSASKEENDMARHLAILKDFSELNHATGSGAHKYTAKQVMRAAKYVAQHQNDSKQSTNAVRNVLGIDGEEAKAIVAEEIGRRYTDVSGTNNFAFRKDVKKGVKAKKISTTTGNAIERRIAQQGVEDALDMAIEEITKDDEKAGARRCYDESMDRVSVKDTLRKERDSHYSEEAFAWAIIAERENRNNEEITMVEDFAREQLDDLPEVSNDVTYNGLTQAEHEKLAEDSKWKFVEELTRAGGTTLTAGIGGVIGAGLNIGLSDDKSAFEEALLGAVGGIAAGDQLAERSMGRDSKTKKLKILNPYTGEIEEFEVKREGLTSDFKWGEIVDIEEPIRFDDERLQHFNYNLDMQYLEHKKEKERKLESQRKRNLYDEALRNNRRNS